MNGQTASLLTFFVLSSLPGAMLVYTAYSPTTGYSFVVFEDSVDDTDSWFEARAKCRVHSQYADLAEISASDFTIVQDLLSNSQASSSSYWIGIYDHLSEMNFKSLYTGADITFANWDNDRPKNDMNKNCGSWDTSNSYWKDEACTGKKRGVLCRMLTPIPSSNIDPNTGCPPTMVPFDDVCYDFRVLMTGNFSSARQACETLPGRMIIPESQSEADFVDLYTILTGKATFWLGITDEEEDNDLRSIYGPNLSFEKWHPSGSGVVASETDCAYIDTSSGYWLTDHCDEPKGVMCSFVPPLLQEETTVAQSITSTSETTQDAFTIVASTDHDVTSPTSSEAQGPYCKPVERKASTVMSLPGHTRERSHRHAWQRSADESLHRASPVCEASVSGR
ncbi:macrophage mannose receptor 1-like [Acanthaster planci]|uniref:Macrophage mannose receptor 1-like n=1 Tax=Acanthaster planci TaxID=133434 RepID=A0A8B7YEH4_ACAPL|nr:macrophage mannose receptor 1-like [Acanthaster planci]